MLAEVQSPKVCLKSCELHVENAYVKIPTDHVITLHNMTMVPAQFNWKEQVSTRTAYISNNIMMCVLLVIW